MAKKENYFIALSKENVISPLVKEFSLEEIPAVEDLFIPLVRTIVFQQLSGKAASTIFGRFEGLFENDVDPFQLIDIDHETLRSVGLSNQKAKYVKNIAHFFIENSDLNGNWSSLSDQEILDHLTSIKGVGVWTAQMILIFYLSRSDIFPTSDLGVQKGMIALFDIKEEKKELLLKIERLSDRWKPYRSYVTRLLYRFLDNSV